MECKEFRKLYQCVVVFKEKNKETDNSSFFLSFYSSSNSRHGNE